MPNAGTKASIGGSKGGAPEVQIVLFLCSFQQNICKIIVSTPTLGVGAPLQENPGSATGTSEVSSFCVINTLIFTTLSNVENKLFYSVAVD